MKSVLFVLAAFVVGAIVGYVPASLELGEVQEQAQATEDQLTAELEDARGELMMSSIHSKLGILWNRVRQADFESAGAVSTELFDEIDAALDHIDDPDDERRLRTAAEARDEITAALALTDPAIEETIERLFRLVSASLLD